MSIVAGYDHVHAAHCESGVLSSLLRNRGLHLSEPMVFGIGGGLCFAYLPFMKMGNLPLVSYRMFPGALLKAVPRKIGARFFTHTYRDQAKAMRELDESIDRGRVVALQTSAYFTTYFPPEMRFQFNAHNIIIIGRDNDTYHVSDPVFPHPVTIGREDLRKARFARGLNAPKGYMHYPIHVPQEIHPGPIIVSSVRRTSSMMLRTPGRWIGIRGMLHLADTIEGLPRKGNVTYARHFLGNVVRMQEEIGTGGGGFRFMYAAFLQEAGEYLGSDLLMENSRRMTRTGDRWRAFAVLCAKIVKTRREAPDYAEAAEALRGCARMEREVYRSLRTIK